MNKTNRIIVALSGGVDSSVAASLLLQEGYEVIGVMLKLWNDPEQGSENRCCTTESMLLARNIAGSLNIPFYVIDAKDAFKTKVFQSFLQGYVNGITPNPCIICNKDIRWRILLEKTKAFEADYLATGHYARVLKIDSTYQLYRGIDDNKDQSYVLHTLNQNDLSKTIFPLGKMTKDQVRKQAREFSITLSEKPDSQDLCFLAGQDYRDLLPKFDPNVNNPGDVLDETGKLIGIHKGLAFYTIGQRRNLGLHSKTPLYVIEKNLSNNSLTVGSKNSLMKNNISVKDINWISGHPPIDSLNAEVQIRYRSKAKQAIISPFEKNTAHIYFHEPVFSVTPGQAAVFYNGDNCLGGGIIIG